MAFFNFFEKPKTADQIAAKLMSIALAINVSDQEVKILRGAGIDIDAYKLQRLLLQIEFMVSFVAAFISRSTGDHRYFFNDVLKLLNREVEAVLERVPKIEFQDTYALKRHMEKYYSLETPENLLTKLFHAIRQETLIRKDANALNVFLQGLTAYVRSIGDVVRPYLKKSP